MSIQQEFNNYINRRYMEVYGFLPEIKIAYSMCHMGIDTVEIKDIPELINRSIAKSIYEWLEEFNVRERLGK